MKWIRFEGHARFHAVWCDHAGGKKTTWCDKRAEQIEIMRELDDAPPSHRCAACVRRIARPYLIPERMQEMLRNRAPAGHSCHLPAMTDGVHRARHEELHRAFDELLACYLLVHPGRMPSNITATELMEWNAGIVESPKAARS